MSLAASADPRFDRHWMVEDLNMRMRKMEEE